MSRDILLSRDNHLMAHFTSFCIPLYALPVTPNDDSSSLVHFFLSFPSPFESEHSTSQFPARRSIESLQIPFYMIQGKLQHRPRGRGVGWLISMTLMKESLKRGAEDREVRLSNFVGFSRPCCLSLPVPVRVAS
jgi:hypothetical protein